MKPLYSSILYVLFLLFILTIPFNSLYDTIAFFQGTVGNKTFTRTPIWFKLYKDIFLGSAILLTISSVVLKLNRRLIGILLFLCLVGVYAMISVAMDPNLAIVLAVRSYLVVFFIFLGFYFFYFETGDIYPAIKIIFLLELVVQGLQLLYAPNYYGGNAYFGLNFTNPGTFLIPSTMASYAVITLYFARRKNDGIVEFLCVLSVLLTRSTTAYLIIFTFYSILVARKLRFSWGLISSVVVIVLAIVYFNLDTITGRPGIINNIYTRLNILWQVVDHPFGIGFGLGSGGSVLLHIDNAIIADSTLNSLLINFGWPGFFAYGLMVFLAFKYFRYYDLLLISFLAFSVTMIIFEMTPFIQFYFFELGRQIRYKSEDQSVP